MVVELMHVRSHQHPGEIPVKPWRKVEIRVSEVGEKRRDDSVNHINVGRDAKYGNDSQNQ